ncbi:MAG: hypothetical protein RQ750_10845 [Roseovarius sp.]|nr:hypothetical protein [Roseovarius sp.]
MKPINKTPKHVLAIAVATTLIFLAAPAVAGEKTIPDGRATAVKYDWHNVSKPVRALKARLSTRERKRMAANVARHGNGSYICSPSGFGKKSQCYTR